MKQLRDMARLGRSTVWTSTMAGPPTHPMAQKILAIAEVGFKNFQALGGT